MELLACLIFVAAPLVLLMLLGRTRFFWLPGAALIAVPVVEFGWLAWKLGPGFENRFGDNLAGLPVLMVALAVVGAVSALYGFICLLIGKAMYRRTPKDELPSSPP